MQVKELMTDNVQVINPDRTLQEAAAEMESVDTGVLPVCEGTKVVGIVTDRDITVRAIAEGLDPARARVQDVMSKGVIYCSAEDDIKDAAKLMEDCQVRRLPVLDQEMNLAGIISLGDIAVRAHNKKLAAEVLEQVSEPVAAHH